MADFYAKIPVYKPGYEWLGRENDPAQDTLVCPKSDEGSDRLDTAVYRFYDPFAEEPALFRVFADLEPYPWPDREPAPEEIGRFREMILRFCNQYGGFHEFAPVVLVIPKEVRLMRAAIELGDAICSENKVVLEKYLYFYEVKTPLIDADENYIPENERSLAEELKLHGWKFSAFTGGGQAFQEYVAQEFGRKKNLRGWALRQTPLAEKIWMDVPRHWHHGPCKRDDLLARATDLLGLVIQAETTYGGVAISVDRSPSSPLAIRVQVTNLLAVLWIQLAVSVIEHRDYHRCKMCGKPFEIGPRTNRRAVPSDKLFCTVNCRVKSFQRRKAQACRMRSEGANLRDIAKAVESDMPQVKKWLGEKE